MDRWKDVEKKSGLEDLPEEHRPCSDPQHHAPSMYCVPHGKRFKNICPTCGHIEYLYPSSSMMHA